MDFKTLVTVILSSGVVSAIVSGFISWYTKRIDFKNEYYKIILRKKIDAYEKLEKIATELRKALVHVPSKKSFNALFRDEQSWIEFSTLKTELASLTLWIKPDTLSIVINIDHIVELELKQIIHSKLVEDRSNLQQLLEDYGIKRFKELDKLAIDLIQAINRDMKTLYKID